MDFIGDSCISFFALLKEFQNHILLNDCILQSLSSSRLFNFGGADQKIEQLQRYREHLYNLLLACQTHSHCTGLCEII